MDEKIKVSSVSNELSQSSIGHVSSNDYSSTLSIHESPEYVLKHNQNTFNDDVPCSTSIYGFQY